MCRRTLPGLVVKWSQESVVTNNYVGMAIDVSGVSLLGLDGITLSSEHYIQLSVMLQLYCNSFLQLLFYRIFSEI